VIGQTRTLTFAGEVVGDDERRVFGVRIHAVAVDGDGDVPDLDPVREAFSEAMT
jgi:hypothetical protein